MLFLSVPTSSTSPKRKEMRKENNLPVIFFHLAMVFLNQEIRGRKEAMQNIGSAARWVGTLKAPSVSEEETEDADILSYFPPPCMGFSPARAESSTTPLMQYCLELLFSSKLNVLNNNSGPRLERSGPEGGGVEVGETALDPQALQATETV